MGEKRGLFGGGRFSSGANFYLVKLAPTQQLEASLPALDFKVPTREWQAGG